MPGGMGNSNNVDVVVSADISGVKPAMTEAKNEIAELARAVPPASEAMRGAAKAADVMKEGVVGLGVESSKSALSSTLLSEAGGVLTTMAGGAAAGVAAWATAQIAATFAIKDSSDEVGKLSQRMGESVESVSELRYAFRLGGTSAEEMAGLMKSLDNKAQDAARGVGQAAAAYQAMGISTTDVNGKLKDSRQILEEVADKIASYKDGAAKAALVQDALGGGWVRLIPLLNGGAQGFRDAATEAKQLGVVFDEKLTKQSAELNDNLTKLSTAAEGVKISFGRDLIPSLTETTSEMVRLKLEGHGVLAMLRGFAGIGKIPFDLIMGDSKPDLSVATQIKDLQGSIGKMELDLKQSEQGGLLNTLIFGKKDELTQKIAVAKNQLSVLEKFKDKLEFKPASPGEVKPDAPIPETKPPKTPRSGGGSGKISDYDQTMRTLAERISVQELELGSTEKLTAAEKEHAKWLADVDSGRKKLTASEIKAAEAKWQTLLGLEKENAEHQKYLAAVDKQEATNQKAYTATLDRIAAAERETELMGLSEAQISAVEQARLNDAIAIAAENGATPEMLAALREELTLRGKLTDALSARDLKKYELDDAKKALQDVGKEMDEFWKKGLGNMQDALAEFLFDPFAEGSEKMAEQFGRTIWKMTNQAASAQILKTLFGDMGKTGSLGSDSLVGKGVSWLSGLFGGGSSSPGLAASATESWIDAGGLGGIPAFATGIDYVPHDMLALIHQGEKVTPAAQNKPGMQNSQQIHQTMHFYGAAEPAQVKRAAASGYRNAAAAMAAAGRY